MIKNYTSGVPVERTVMRIEVALIAAGAIGIYKDYKDGVLGAICFSIQDPTSRLLSVRLPSDSKAVYEVLLSRMKRPRKETLKKLKDQAARTSWKLVQDWVEIQISLIEMRQAEFLQVFLPYIWNGKQTYYESLKEGGFKALPEHVEGKAKKKEQS